MAWTHRQSPPPMTNPPARLVAPPAVHTPRSHSGTTTEPSLKTEPEASTIPLVSPTGAPGQDEADTETDRERRHLSSLREAPPNLDRRKTYADFAGFQVAPLIGSAVLEKSSLPRKKPKKSQRKHDKLGTILAQV